MVPTEPDSIATEKKEVPDAGLGQKVTVRLFGSIRAAAGSAGEEVEIPSGWVAYEFLRLLSDTYGAEFRNEVFLQTGELRDDLSVSVNGVITEHTKLGNLKLPDGAIIALLPTFPGGG